MSRSSQRIQGSRRMATVLALVSLVGLASATDNRSAIAGELTPESSLVGTLSCSSTSCHGQTDSRVRPGRMFRNEFVTWMQSDPHAQAARTVHSPRFIEILARLGAVQDNGDWNRATYTRCAKCHDPANDLIVAAADSPIDIPTGSWNARGIGCESCHGAARPWLAKHYERGIDRLELIRLGMRPTKDVDGRAQICAACHVGSHDNDMNHEMIAAGHPVLRFELAAYHRRLPKHWRSDEERERNRDFEAQIWNAGQFASAHAAAELLLGRAERAVESEMSGKASAPWPEFSEYQCFACHQPLRPAALQVPQTDPVIPRSRGGSPRWNDWSWLGVESQWAKSADTGKALQLLIELRKLQGELASPSLVQSSARELRTHHASRSRSAPSKSPTDFDYGNASDLLSVLGDMTAGEPTWERACQVYLGLTAADRAFQDDMQFAVRRGQLSDESVAKLRGDDKVIADQFTKIRRSLVFDDERDWPSRWATDSRAQADGEVPLLVQRASFAEMESIRQVLLRRQVIWDSIRAAPGYGGSQ